MTNDGQILGMIENFLVNTASETYRTFWWSRPRK